jgi:hypothetical protein
MGVVNAKVQRQVAQQRRVIVEPRAAVGYVHAVEELQQHRALRAVAHGLAHAAADAQQARDDALLLHRWVVQQRVQHVEQAAGALVRRRRRGGGGSGGLLGRRCQRVLLAARAAGATGRHTLVVPGADHHGWVRGRRCLVILHAPRSQVVCGSSAAAAHPVSSAATARCCGLRDVMLS